MVEAIAVISVAVVWFFFGYVCGNGNELEHSYIEYKGNKYKIESNDYNRVTIKDERGLLSSDVSGEDVKVILKKTLTAAGYARSSNRKHVYLSLWEL